MYSRNCIPPSGPAATKPGSGLVEILVASQLNFAACNMVTVITEKLQNQSLDDVKFAEIVPYQTRSKTKARVWQHQSIQHVALSGNKGTPQVICQEKLTPERPNRSHPTTPQSAAPSKKLEIENNAINDTLQAPAPPKKRHCRSLSAGELIERKWRPRSSKIWRAPPVQGGRRKCESQLHSPHQKSSGGGGGGLAGIPNSSGLNPSFAEFSTPPESPVPRPTSSASWDGSTCGIPYWLEHATFRPVLSPRAHSLSLSEDKASESSGSVCSFSGSTDSEMDRGVVPQRCHSHPSVRKSGKKRRREEEIRPKLDLFKMEEAPFVAPAVWPCRSREGRVIACKNKYHTRSHCKPPLDSQAFCGLQTIASSPRDNGSSHASSILITPTSSPTKELDQQSSSMLMTNKSTAAGPQYSFRHTTRSSHDTERDVAANSSDDDNGEDADRDDGCDSGIFPLDPSSELDVDQIEQN